MKLRLDYESGLTTGSKGRSGEDGAAARLGINRTTLLSRMKQLGIHPNRRVTPPGLKSIRRLHVANELRHQLRLFDDSLRE